MTLIELLEDLNIPYKLHGEHHHVTEGWFGLECPHCSPNSGSFKFGVNLRTWGASCWSCGTHSLASVLSAATDRTPYDCHQLLQKVRGNRPQEFKEVKQGLYDPPTNVGGLQTAHKQYLRSRGFDPNEISRVWGVKGIGRFPIEYAWRLFIPVSLEGIYVTWTTRSVSLKPTAQRYLNAPYWRQKHPLKDLLYGEDFVRHTCIVTEGPIDCWAIGPGTVCTFGVAYTQAQVARLACHPVRVVLFDSEPQAQQRAEKLVNDLSAFPGETYKVQLFTGKDAASCSKTEILQLRKRFLE